MVARWQMAPCYKRFIMDAKNILDSLSLAKGKYLSSLSDAADCPFQTRLFTLHLTLNTLTKWPLIRTSLHDINISICVVDIIISQMYT